MLAKQFKNIVILLFVSVCFTKLITLPAIGQKVQLTEISFLFFIGWLICNSKHLELSIRSFILTKIEKKLLAFLFFVGVSAVVGRSLSAFLEFAGLIYLSLLFILLRVLFFKFEDSTNYLILGIKMMGVVAIFMSIISFGIGLTGLEEQFGWELTEGKYFPGVGFINRAEGMTMSPNQLADILMLFIFLIFALDHSFERKTTILLILFAFFALLLTGAKSIILAFVGLLFIYFSFKKSHKFRAIGTIIGFCSITFFLFASHFIWLSNNDLHEIQKTKQTYATGTVFLKNESGQLIGSTYLQLKKIAVNAILEYPFFGLGGGKFNEFIKEKQKLGQLDKSLPAFDPHSSFFGIPAELGLIVFSFFVWWITAIFRLIFNLKIEFENKNRAALIVAFSSYILIWVINSLVMDVMNIRQFWLVLAGISFLTFESQFEQKIKTQLH